MKPPYLVIFALLAVGTGGFFAGRISSDPAANTPEDGDQVTVGGRSSGDRAGSDSTEPGTRRTTRITERRTRSSSGFTPESSKKLETIVRGEDALDRYRSMLSFIDGLAPEDFESAVSSFRELGITEQRFGEYAMLLSAWAKVDPEGALAYAKANTNGSFATDTILSAWASNDPEAAIRWAQANHEGDEANPYLVGIIRALGSTDPLRATQLLTSMPRSVTRGEALESLLPSLLLQGNEATRAWIDSLQDDSLKNGAMMRVAERFARTDPQGTLAWLQANPSEATDRRVDDVFHTWAEKDPSAAMSAFEAMPAGKDRSNALRGIVTNMAQVDPTAAIALMDRYPSDVNERMIHHFAWQTFRTDPSAAAGQIYRIPDAESRSQMYRRYIGAWLEEDRDAAGAWLQRNAALDPALGALSTRLQQQRQ